MKATSLLLLLILPLNATAAKGGIRKGIDYLQSPSGVCWRDPKSPVLGKCFYFKAGVFRTETMASCLWNRGGAWTDGGCSFNFL